MPDVTPKPEDLPIEAIEVTGRLRPVTEAGVESLLASFRDIGVIKDAIHVRRSGRGEAVRLRLLAGGHRLEAARRLGWTTIRAQVWTDITDDLARLIEVDDNLAGAEMDALDTAVFLAERKRVYERLHPETVAKTGAALVAHRWNTADMMSVVSFATATAQKFGLTDRHVRRMIAVGTALTRDEVGQLRAAPRPVTLADLQALSRIGDEAERGIVVRQLAEGAAKSAAAARRSLQAATSVEAPREDAFRALRDAWSRAPKQARRRFVSAVFDDLSPLVADEAETRDAADAAAARTAPGVAAE